jgi:ABC-type branched-subunit amino acid transport system permease subunit
MIRIALSYGLPFLMPFGAYAVYVYLTRRAEAQGIQWQDAPWVWLVLSGLVLVIVTFVSMGLLTGADPSGTYVPPHTEGGRIVPAEVK